MFPLRWGRQLVQTGRLELPEQLLATPSVSAAALRKMCEAASSKPAEESVPPKAEKKQKPVPPPPMSSKEYNAKKVEFGKQMHALRSRLYQEVQEKKGNKIKRDEEERAAIQAHRKDKQLQRLKAREARADSLEEEQRLIKEEKKKRKEEGRSRQIIREQLWSKAREERYAYLVNQSKQWITRENLDQRIENAVKYSDPLSFM